MKERNCFREKKTRRTKRVYSLYNTTLDYLTGRDRYIRGSLSFSTISETSRVSLLLVSRDPVRTYIRDRLLKSLYILARPVDNCSGSSVELFSISIPFS